MVSMMFRQLLWFFLFVAGHFPVVAGSIFGFNLGAYGWPEKTHTIYGVRLNLGASERHALYGLDLGTFSRTSGSVSGIQANLFGQEVDAAMHGIQFAIMANTAGVRTRKDAVRDPVLERLTPPASDDAAQQALVYPMTGIQVSGFSNLSRWHNGMQFTVGVNATGTLQGVQFAVIKNFAARMGGVQLGLINEAYITRGVQAGVFNTTHYDLKGAQIGLVNVVNWHHFSLAVSESRMIPLLNIGW